MSMDEYSLVTTHSLANCWGSNDAPIPNILNCAFLLLFYLNAYRYLILNQSFKTFNDSTFINKYITLTLYFWFKHVFNT